MINNALGDDLFLTPAQLAELKTLIHNFLRLPFGYKLVPGNLLEEMIAQVRGEKAVRLAAYDFVDVIDKEKRVGWQVKSLNHDTPVTWIRAKIAGKSDLISASKESGAAVKR